MTTIEAIAAIFGLASVWLTVRQNIWCWPTGLVMVALYILVFLDAKLYADMALQVVYILLSIYGWVHWARGGDRHNPLAVTTLTSSARVLWAVGVLIFAAALGRMLETQTDASLPFPDAMITSLSLAAQYLMARKKLESWCCWIAVDVLAIMVFSFKGLYITAGLYSVFLGLAILGYIEWSRAKSTGEGSSSGSSCRPTGAINS